MEKEQGVGIKKNNMDIVPELVTLSLRVRDKFAWTEVEALQVAVELHYALSAKALDNDGTSVSPVLDALWHELILETRLYVTFCDKVLGGTLLHHSTMTANDTVEKKNKRIDRLLMIYESCFQDRKPEAWIWAREDAIVATNRKRKEIPYNPLTTSGIQIYIKDLDGRTRTIRVDLNDTVEFCKQVFAKRTNRDCIGGMRFIFAGRQLEDGMTLAYYKVQQESTIHHMQRLRGC